MLDVGAPIMSRAGEETRWLRFVKKRLRPNLLVKALSGVAVLWCFLPADDTTALAVHRRFRRQCWVEGGATGAVILIVGFILWFPLLLWLIGVYTWRCGARVRRQTGAGIIRQILGQLYVALRYAVPPPWFYMFEFYRPARRRRALDYIYRMEIKGSIYNMLRTRLSSPATLDALSDKSLFASYCTRHGLNVLPTLAMASQGIIQTADGGDLVLDRDVFFKPRRGAGGRGASRWLYQGDDRYLDSNGDVSSADTVMDHLRRLSYNSDYIVRPYVVSHDIIASISGSALSTVRIVTCLDPHGQAVATHAVLRMARSADVVVDNFHCGGIAAAVDLDSGRLGQATDMGLRADSRWYETHPLTDNTIAGVVVPYWPAAVELARQAHAIFDDQIAVGWDIAILADGPYLVEGNKGPDLDIIQRVCGEPVGNTELGLSLLHYLDVALQQDRTIAATTDDKT